VVHVNIPCIPVERRIQEQRKAVAATSLGVECDRLLAGGQVHERYEMRALVKARAHVSVAQHQRAAPIAELRIHQLDRLAVGRGRARRHGRPAARRRLGDHELLAAGALELHHLAAQHGERVHGNKRTFASSWCAVALRQQRAQSALQQHVSRALDLCVVHGTVGKHLGDRGAGNDVVELIEQRQAPHLLELRTGIHCRAVALTGRQRRVHELDIVQQTLGTSVTELVARLRRVRATVVLKVLLITCAPTDARTSQQRCTMY